MNGSSSDSLFAVVGMILLPFVIGIFTGVCSAFLMKRSKNNIQRLVLLLAFLCISALCGLLADKYIFHSFSLNYLLVGLGFSATIANLIPEQELADVLKLYNPVLNLSLVIVIVNLGMPLDYRLIAGAGLFTAIYIFSRAIGKIGGAYLGGKMTKADAAVTKYLGFILLPHSGVSLVFTGIAVIIAKFAFQWAGEIKE